MVNVRAPDQQGHQGGREESHAVPLLDLLKRRCNCSIIPRSLRKTVQVKAEWKNETTQEALTMVIPSPSILLGKKFLKPVRNALVTCLISSFIHRAVDNNHGLWSCRSFDSGPVQCHFLFWDDGWNDTLAVIYLVV